MRSLYRDEACGNKSIRPMTGAQGMEFLPDLVA
jgi:hypothetical protein